MKRFLPILLGLGLTAWTAVAAPPPSFRHLPGYMVTMKCDPFSKAALRHLHRNGVPAIRITYGWSCYAGPDGFHAAILFQWEGRFYFMDNQRMGPRRVAGKTDLGCVDHVTGGFGKSQWMTDENNKRIPPRRMSELFAPAPVWLRELQVGPKR